MTSAASNVASQLLGNVLQLPLWVKQVLYLELHKELSQFFTVDSLKNMSPEDTLAFFTPKILPDGQKHSMELRDEMGKLLIGAQQRLSILDICLRYSWSLEACARLLFEAIQNHWIQPPSSLKAMGTIEYLANHIRLGEYLVKMGRITPEQLEQALRTQQYIKEALQEHTGLANILINLGYITRHDTEGILFLKQESRKPLEQNQLLDTAT